MTQTPIHRMSFDYKKNNKCASYVAKEKASCGRRRSHVGETEGNSASRSVMFAVVGGREHGGRNIWPWRFTRTSGCHGDRDALQVVQKVCIVLPVSFTVFLAAAVAWRERVG